MPRPIKAASRKKSTAALDTWLAEHSRFGPVELQGFATALLTGPRVPPPADWMAVLVGEDFRFGSKADVRAVVGSIEAAYFDPMLAKLRARDPGLAPPADDEDAQAEFAASYLEGLRMMNSWDLDKDHAAWPLLFILAVIAGEVPAGEAYQEAVEQDRRFQAASADEWLASQRKLLTPYVHTLYELLEERRKRRP